MRNFFSVVALLDVFFRGHPVRLPNTIVSNTDQLPPSTNIIGKNKRFTVENYYNRNVRDVSVESVALNIILFNSLRFNSWTFYWDHLDHRRANLIDGSLKILVVAQKISIR